MPGPDPHALWIEGEETGRGLIVFESSPDGNRRNRAARAKAIRHNLRWGGWKCRWCWQPVPTCKRADARFCSESCRKKDARRRRKWGCP